MSFFDKIKAWNELFMTSKLTKARDIVTKFKKEAVISVAVFTVGITGAGIGHTYYQSQVDTIYHVYLHDNKIGIVDQPEVITEWIENKIIEESNRFDHVQLQQDKDLRYEAEQIYRPNYDNENALKKLEEEFSLKAQAVKLMIDGQFIGYVSDEESIYDLLDSYKREFVSEEFLAILDTQSIEKENVVSMASLTSDENESLIANETQLASVDKVKLDQPQMVEVEIKQKIELEQQTVHPNQVLSIDQVKDRLSQSKLEEKIHTVSQGEVLGIIAQNYGLKISELLALNPSMNENSVLQIGQELVVTAEEPFITVLTYEKLKTEEVIKYSIETKSDPNMYRGDTRTEQQGKDGKKIVDYTITRQNGIEVDKIVDNEEILIEPVKKIIVRGEKQKPSRGEGTFKWPTVGGKITSSYGQRWGRLHQGIDIAGVSNRTIMAADNGKVTTVGWQRFYGNYIVIDHDNGYKTLYAHLSSFGVSEGEIVKKGDSIGVMGSTGRSTGIHLHFEIIKNGKVVNPIGYFRR
jgi:murein DD-endopeptidase MepM/ murein hydrolase activator NlpD